MNRPSLQPTSRPFVVFKRLFSLEECTRILAFARACGELEEGRVFSDEIGEFVVDRGKRQVAVWWHSRHNDSRWIFERMDEAFRVAASRLDLRIAQASEEDLKIMVYGPGDHFATWHRDTGPSGPERTRTRALSMSVELSDRSTYGGGTLQLYDSDGRGIVFNTAMGGAVAFRSDTLHRVTPVIHGTRISLVNWISHSRLEGDV